VFVYSESTADVTVLFDVKDCKLQKKKQDEMSCFKLKTDSD